MDVANVTLAANKRYFIGGFYERSLDLAVTSFPGDLTTIAQITFGGATCESGGTLANPTTSFGGGGHFGPNFTTAAVPEPATWALMIIGFGVTGLGLRSRRRIQAAV